MKWTAMLIAMLLWMTSTLLRAQETIHKDSIASHQDTESKRYDHTVNFGMKGGFTSSLFLIPHLTVNNKVIDEVQNNYKIGYFASIFMRINFGRHFLQPEVSYHINRCSILFNKELPEGASEGSIPEQASITSEIHSIDIPVIYGYNIIKQGPYSLAVFGGPKIRYILNDQSEITFENFDQTNIHEELQPLNVSATLGVAVTISRIFFDFRYDISLHNISKEVTYDIPPSSDGSTDWGSGLRFHRRDNVLSFSLGVFF